jgi:mRNA interferase MazF
MKRYDIVWADLDPVRGSEIAKTRPVVVVSMDVLNEVLSTITICPLTSQLHPGWRSRVQIRCAGKAAEIAVDQIRTISKQRLGRKLDALSENEASVLRRVITEMYGE